MFTRILYATDGSDHARKALDYTQELAEKYEAEVIVLHAYPHVFDALGTPDYERILNRRLEAGTEVLSEAEKALEAAGLKVKRELLEGPVAEAILNVAGVRESYAAAGMDARVEPFIENMADAYAWADLVICRAGALTVAELAVVGIASVLVPFPYATDDHQTANAHHLADAGAAVLLPQDRLQPERLAEIIRDFSCQREVLLEMSGRARGLAMPDAARRVATLCLRSAGVAA